MGSKKRLLTLWAQAQRSDNAVEYLIYDFRRADKYLQCQKTIKKKKKTSKHLTVFSSETV